MLWPREAGDGRRQPNSNNSDNRPRKLLKKKSKSFYTLNNLAKLNLELLIGSQWLCAKWWIPTSASHTFLILEPTWKVYTISLFFDAKCKDNWWCPLLERALSILPLQVRKLHLQLFRSTSQWGSERYSCQIKSDTSQNTRRYLCTS